MKKYAVDIYVNDHYIGTEYVFAKGEIEAEELASSRITIEYQVSEDE